MYPFNQLIYGSTKSRPNEVDREREREYILMIMDNFFKKMKI